MKRIKKIFASLMVVVMVLTAAPLSGFVGMELKLDWLNFDWLDFTPKASAASYSGTCGDNLTWSLDTTTGELVISGTGEMKDFSEFSSPWFKYRSSIKRVTIGNSVAGIGNYAFESCSNLTDVTMSNRVNGIGEYAFYDCKNLENVYYSGYVIDWCSIYFANSYSNPMCSADNLYFNMELVKELVIPNDVISIGNYSFYNFAELTSITIPDSVTNIGNYAFYNCTGLTSITIPDNVESIGYYAFSGCKNMILYLSKGSYAETYANENVVPYYFIADDSVEESISITSSSVLSFEVNTQNYTMTINCTDAMPSFTAEDIPWTEYKGYIKYVIIKDGCTSISENAFKNFNAIKSITVPDSVISIGSYAFYNCDGLIGMTIGSGATSIGSYAFYDCDNLYSVSIPDSVTSIGDYTFHNCTRLANVTIGNGVKSIGNSAFYGCSSLTNITIPDSVFTIGEKAFYNCTGLTELTMPISAEIYNSKYTFYRCNNINKITLTKGDGTVQSYTNNSAATNMTYYQYTPWYISGCPTVVIADGVTAIGYYTFNDCSKLVNITIPDSVTRIDVSAFWCCSSLESVTIPDSVISIDSSAFSGCNSLTNVTIGNGVISIGSSAFWGCSGLTQVTIPDSVTSIGDSAFYNCDNLTNLIIGNSVKNIGSSAFRGCSGLTQVTIPDSVTSIGAGAFYNCDNLTNVTIGDSVTTIGNSAFEGCVNITSVTMPGSVSSIGSYAFYDVCDDCIFYVEKDSYAETYVQNNNILYYYLCNKTEEKIVSVTVTSKLNFEVNKETYTMTINCSGNMLSFVNEDAPWTPYKRYIKNVVINDDCTSIGDNAFVDFIGLKSIIIPDGVTSLGSSVFSGCTRLTNITIPGSVTSIGSSAFRDCPKLTVVIIPEEVTNIGSSAFSGCTGLTRITIPDSVTSIGSSAFSGCTGLANVTIGNGITSIGYDAFYNCKGIKELTMSISPSISYTTFYNCNNIEKVTLTKGNGMPKNFTSSNCSYTPWYISREKCTEVIIEDGVTGIGDYMFYGCTNLSDITLPLSVNSIGNNAFSGCQKLEKLTVNNPNCTFGTECTSYYTTICGYAGSTAEAYANEMGFDFELIVPCEHNNYHIEHKDSTCIEIGYEKLICDDCGSTFSYTEIPKVDHDYKTITAPPTCVDEGTVVCLCRVCRDAYISEILDPLGHSELVWVTVKVPSTRNEGIMNQVCPACGEVFDTKTVPAISLSADSTANIDFETNTISGFVSGSSSIGDYLSATNNGYTFTCESEKIATGTVITLTAGEDTINEFEAVIFGDTNGDGWYDGQDAIIVDCLANGMLTKEDVGEAVYMAADCNHDGVIDQADVALLNEAGTLLSNVDQSKPAEVLLETSSEYVEYLDLIDQSPEIEIEDETEDIPEADVDTTPEQDRTEANIFEMIINFIRSIFELFLTFIPVPYK